MAWITLDDTQNWMGEWSETTAYSQYDTVLYKSSDGSEWHTFISKTSHNVGNQPTTEPAYWRRYYQEQFK